MKQRQHVYAASKAVRGPTLAPRSTTQARTPAPHGGLLTLQRTVGNRATGRLLRENAGARALQAKMATSAALHLLVQRDTVTESEDPWDKLSGPGREKAEQLFEECENVIRALSSGQQSHMSLLRQSWLNTLQKMLARIGTLDNETQLQGARNAFDDYTRGIDRNIAQFKAEWAAVKERYTGERRYLLSAAKDSVDFAEAAKYLEDKYNETPRDLDAPFFPTTPEDYLGLQDTLDHKKHLRHGMLVGARTRGKRLKEMLDVVEELHLAGQSADKYIPGWSAQVGEEAAHLEKIAGDSVMAEYREEIVGLRKELLEQRQRAAEAHPREKTLGEKAFGVVEAVGEFVWGAAEAVVGPFVEAAKEAMDLAKIALHFASFGYYEPKFQSDMAAAAAQGQGTVDLLKGMAVGILETPSRFLKALEDGDWEAVGRETVNLYGLAKAIEAAPEMARKIKNLPEMLVKVRRGLRIFKARKVALQLQYEGRIVPEPAPSASGGQPAGGPKAGFDEPQILREAPVPPEIKKLGVNPDTLKMLETHQELRDALVESPRAAEALTSCKSTCIPEFARRGQVRRLNKLLTDLEKAGVKVDLARLKNYLHSFTDEVSLGEAIDRLAEVSGELVEQGAKAANEPLIDVAELAEQPGVREGKPTDVRLAEARHGQRFDVEEGQKYPANQVPIRDKGGRVRRLDSYDPTTGEIISRKSLVTSNGQIALADEFTMIEYFQEFDLKYPDGATIANTRGSRRMVVNGKRLAGQTLKGRYVLEVPPQRYAIPDRILGEARKRGIAIRDTNGKVY